ncbi:MAG TPA: ABC transporter permease [Bacillota bacterium]|jgi:oligopeptide transport system permease protein|nr:ABC transporter permease [Peptococcaceae bacterium MAG4]HPU35180.1 ABC transporter permease [Bacillota bacterium]HPZ42969.1 ABC transporter permease [Bacillota bacterium]HQD75357.1 ABC transporter permease [Bacillota bacterium]HUM58140.1 ABC transporter permease [Bacillota bacterium]
MLVYILKRAGFNLGVMLVVVTLTFFLMHLLPGDPFMSQRLNPEIKANLYAKHGLDQPVARQYLDYLSALARFDLGESLKYPGRTVNEIIAESFPVSAAVGILALVLALVLGVTLGVLAGVWQSRWPDRLILAFSTLGLSIPNFALGAGLVYLFALKLKIFPVAMLEKPIDLVLPVLTLAAWPAAVITRLIRTEMIEVLKRDYIIAAMVRGLDPARVILRHALPNALPAVIHYSGPLAATLLTGSFIVEKIFALPGLGQYYITSIGNRDYNLVAGITIFYTFVLLVATFLTDLLAFSMNPQLRYRNGS